MKLVHPVFLWVYLFCSLTNDFYFNTDFNNFLCNTKQSIQHFLLFTWFHRNFASIDKALQFFSSTFLFLTFLNNKFSRFFFPLLFRYYHKERKLALFDNDWCHEQCLRQPKKNVCAISHREKRKYCFYDSIESMNKLLGCKSKCREIPLFLFSSV